MEPPDGPNHPEPSPAPGNTAVTPGRAARLALMGLFSVSVAACGSGTVPPAPSARLGQVVGVVRAGPTCPVERKSHPCRPAPVAAALVEARLPGGGIVAEVRTSKDGSYSLSVTPGHYELVIGTPNFLPHCPSRMVTVTSGSRQPIDFACDTGIR